MANLLDGRPWDYVIGSVHFLRDAALDIDEFDVWEGGADPDRVWRRYFALFGRLLQGLSYPSTVSPSPPNGASAPYPRRIALRILLEVEAVT